MNDAVFGIHVHDERDAQLSVLVLEEEGGVVPARHLHPLGPVRLAGARAAWMWSARRSARQKTCRQ